MSDIKWKKLVISIAIPLLTGILSSLITGNNMAEFELMNKPPLSPPGFIFPVVWTVLYILMGISYYIVSEAKGKNSGDAKLLYGLQLFVNFFWSIIFFSLKAYTFAVIWTILLLVLVISMTVSFYKVKRIAGYLQIPYVIWTAFATYITVAISILN